MQTPFSYIQLALKEASFEKNAVGERALDRMKGVGNSGFEQGALAA